MTLPSSHCSSSWREKVALAALEWVTDSRSHWNNGAERGPGSPKGGEPCRWEPLSRIAAQVRTEMGLAAVALKVREGEGLQLRMAHGFSAGSPEKGGPPQDLPAWLTEEKCLLSERAEVDQRGLLPKAKAPFETLSEIAVRDGDDLVAVVYLADPRPGVLAPDDAIYLERLFTCAARAQVRIERGQTTASAQEHPGRMADRRRTEEALAASETRLRQADAQLQLLKFSVDRAPYCAYWFDPEGRCIYVNEAGCRALGYTHEELLAMRIFDVSPRADGERWQELWRRLREEGGFIVESEHRRKDQTVFPVEISAVYFTYGGREYCHGFARDLSGQRKADRERVVLQGQLLQAQKMESVGRLAGGIAHDFNNMLGVILGNAELVMGQVEPGGTVYHDVVEIQTAAKRSAELTRQLLAFARRQPAAPRPIDLNETVRGILPMLGRLVGEDVDLTFEPCEGPWQVNVDPSQVEQVLTSLAVNARDAISGVGKVQIFTLNTTLDATPSDATPNGEAGDYVVLGVSDSGCGMTAEVVDRLFEPFFTTKGSGASVGLGLAMVYGIVTQNGGFIEVESKPGAGSVFRIHLARYRTSAVTSRDHRAAAPAADRKRTILVVEDEAAILRLGRRILERQGYQVLTAATPSEALELVDKHSGPIHLLLVDVVMPEMNGRQLASLLAERRPGLGALFMSGYPAEHIAHRGIVEEGLLFLQKPFTGNELIAKIQAALVGRET